MALSLNVYTKITINALFMLCKIDSTSYVDLLKSLCLIILVLS